MKQAGRASLLAFGVPAHGLEWASDGKLHGVCTMMASLPQLRMMP
jgi:hypothetical protein